MFIQTKCNELSFADLIRATKDTTDESRKFPYKTFVCRCGNCQFCYKGKCSLKECCCMGERVKAGSCSFSVTQIKRYIRLTELVPELLEMVDNGRMGFRPAVEISYLQEEEQRDLVETIDTEDCTPSLAQAIRMKELSREGKLDMDTIFGIMTEEKPNQREKIKIPAERFEKYFKRGTSPQVIEETIFKALDFYQAAIARKRSQEAR